MLKMIKVVEFACYTHHSMPRPHAGDSRCNPSCKPSPTNRELEQSHARGNASGGGIIMQFAVLIMNLMP